MLNQKICRNLLLCLCGLCLVGCGVTRKATSDKGAPVPSSGLLALQVQGNRIITTSGSPLILRGVNAIDPLRHATDTTNHEGAGAYSEAYFAAMASWGANVVRLPVHPADWRNTSNANALAILDQAVNWAKQHDLYVIIDFHSIGMVHLNNYFIVPGGDDYSTSLNEIVAYWSTIAAHYKNEPAVAAYEIFNEPVHLGDQDNLSDWTNWKADAETIIDAIRTLDPQKIIIVGGLNWSYDLSAVSGNPINRTNIAYATHVYPGKNYAKDWDAAFGNIADSYPVIATEIGYLPGSAEDPIGENTYHAQAGETYTGRLKNYFVSKNISWVAWCFSASWRPVLLNDGNTYTPSTAGQYFKDWLASY